MASQNASDTVARVQASPLSGFPRPGLVPIFNTPLPSLTATTAGGVVPITAAQFLSGYLQVDCQDAQSASTPTAAALCEAIPGVTGTAQATGTCGFFLVIRNLGDTTLTITAGTGATLTGGTFTLLTVTSRIFFVAITDSTPGAEAYTVFNVGPLTY